MNAQRVKYRIVTATDPALWTVRPAFGPAGGPDEIYLTTEGMQRAFSVGAQVRRGAPAMALGALALAGGEGVLSTSDGSKLRLTDLGRFDQMAWGHLRALGYVESFGREGVRLTEKGRTAIASGRDEQTRLLERCKRAAGMAAQP